jgi:hypothetical protein
LAIKADPESIINVKPEQINQKQVNAAMEGKSPAAVVTAFKWIEVNRADLVNDTIREHILSLDGSVLIEIGTKATKRMVEAAFRDKDTNRVIQAYSFAIRNMPLKVDDSEIEKLVQRSRFAMEHTPAERQTQTIIDKALEHDVGAFPYIAQPTDAAIIKALSELPSLIDDNKYVKEHITTEHLIHAAQINPIAVTHEFGGLHDVGYVPKTIDLQAVCLAAVKANGLALEYILDQTVEIIRTAVEQTPDAWQFVDRRHISKDADLAKKVLKYGWPKKG